METDYWLLFLCIFIPWTIIGYIYFWRYMRYAGSKTNKPIPLRYKILGGPLVWLTRLYVIYRNRKMK